MSAETVGLVRKIVAGDVFRKTRIHDEQGNIVPLVEIAYLPLRLCQAVLARFNLRSATPWWPPAAVRRIDRLANKNWTVVEFGSGMSTLWLAERFGHVISVESNSEWYKRVAAMCVQRSNIDYIFRPVSNYTDLPAQLPHVDLVIVDGARRADCIDWAMKHLEAGRYLYLDNSDADKDHVPGPSPRTFLARRKLLEMEATGKVSLQIFRGFPPANLVASEGFLAKIER